MNIVNRRLSLDEFKAYINGFNFNPNNPTRIVIHHTYSPNKAQWRGEKSMLVMKGIYESKGWPSGPHLYIEDNGIWLFTPMNIMGSHATSTGNPRSIGIEVVGDYTNEKWSGLTKDNVLGTVKALQKRLNLNNEVVRVHREFTQTQCPGNAISREWILEELNNFNIMKKYEAPDWATEGVKFVMETLVEGEPLMGEIRNEQDARLSVVLERFYKLIKS